MPALTSDGGAVAAGFPRFRARPPWWGGDLQTLRNYFRPTPVDLGAYSQERLEFPMSDGSGDTLLAILHRPTAVPSDGVRRPLAILIHGLTGDEDSSYMLVTAGHLLGLGHPVMRLNLRGAGPSRPRCRFQYHAGRSEDLRASPDAARWQAGVPRHPAGRLFARRQHAAEISGGAGAAGAGAGRRQRFRADRPEGDADPLHAAPQPRLSQLHRSAA